MKRVKGKRSIKRTVSIILTIMAAVLFFICFNAYAQESMQFNSEAKKLEFIRQTLKKEKYLRSDEDATPHCKQMMTDLLAGKNFTAIEPFVRADSIDDPRMAKWRQCEKHEDGGPFVFISLDDLGAPPYRWYRLELDGNKKNGPEDMIYHNFDRRFRRTTGYTWVDLKKCDIKRGFTATGAITRTSSNPDEIYLNALVYYKGTLWVLDFVDGFNFELKRWLGPEGIETCLWWLFEPKKIVK